MSAMEERGIFSRAVVIVPLYKAELRGEEEASFVHNAEVLKHHDIVAVYPEGLDVSYYGCIAPDVKYRAFGANDFSSVKRYNRLLISPRFYKSFAEYDYMLICHFDAWVFKDELSEWCGKGYDYIGAPFLEPFVGKTTAVLPFLATICINKIGNGGLCLRKISTHIKITQRLRLFSWFYFYNEDVFFTLFPPLVLKRYVRPSAAEAIRFAVEERAEQCMKELQGSLPFGCHGWFKRNQELWARHIHCIRPFSEGEEDE